MAGRRGLTVLVFHHLMHNLPVNAVLYAPATGRIQASAKEGQRLKHGIKGALRRAALSVPLLRGLRDELKPAWWKFAPPGHFYSPIPSIDEVRLRERELFHTRPTRLPGIDLNEDAQLRLLHSFESFYSEQPFPSRRGERDTRYWFENPFYSYSDGLCLYFMLRHGHPRRVIEVGSGYSSCATLDTNDLFLDGASRCTFIEPYPRMLESLLRPGDRERIDVVPKPLQEIPLETFAELEANDILFIDSTHVAKVGSDVNYIFAEILPALRSGVYVHFHDIFYPFEYPLPWILEGRAWNETYVLRAFLAFNSQFEIVLFNTYLEQFHRSYFEQHMPLCLLNEGASIWLRRR